MKDTFPEGFLWGTATASYQVEGGIENNDWAEAARQGRVPVCGKATDHYNRYEEDFDIAKSLGHNTHRLSIEWSRIEPEEGKFDEREVEHYRKVLRALKARGLEPFVTLWHFTLPVWFSKKGGFLNKRSVQTFSRYCTYVLEKLGSEAQFWITINEPLVWASGGHLQGRWPPFRKNPLEYFLVQKRMAKAHRNIYIFAKKIFPKLAVGVAQNEFSFEHDGRVQNSLKASVMRWLWNDRFLNAIESHQDFVGLNFYRTWRFTGDKSLTSQDFTDMGWGIDPGGIYQVLLGLKKYKKPVYITENGLADASDSKRADFIRAHLKYIKMAIDEGVDVRGYFYWSLLDNYEWAFGFKERFGLVEVDYETMERKIRPSAYTYQKIIKDNGI
jgi:beta-glucosidase